MECFQEARKGFYEAKVSHSWSSSSSTLSYLPVPCGLDAPNGPSRLIVHLGPPKV